MMKNITVFIMVLGGFVLAGCMAPVAKQVVTTPTVSTQSPAPISVKTLAKTADAAQEPVDLSPTLLYRLMVAEIAGQRGRLDLAVENYVAAARLSRDPRVAERATRIAVYARNDSGALAAAKLWVELVPDNMEAHQVVAAVLVRTGQGDEALKHLEKVLSQGKQSEHQNYMLITSLLSKEKDKQAALEVMEKLVATRQKNANALYSYSYLGFLVGELQKAEAAINKAIGLRAESTDYYILRANIISRQGKASQALQSIEKALEDYPNDTRLRLYYARKLVDEKQLQAAHDQFAQVIDDVPDNHDALYALGLLALKMDELDEANKSFKRLVKLGKRVNEASYYLGQVEEAREDTKAAMQWYGVVRSGQYHVEAQIRISVLMAQAGKVKQARNRLGLIVPKTLDIEVRLYLAEGEILREVKQYEEAFELYSEALHKMPDNIQLLYARALTAEKIERVDITIQDLKQILAHDPNHVQALNALGYTLVDEGKRLSEGFDYIKRAYELHPNDAAIIDSMGWAHYRLGNHKEAAKYLHRAFALLKDAEIAAHLGEVLWVLGEQETARSVWQEALRETPRDEILLDVIRRFTE